MATFNQIVCLGAVGNTGQGTCNYQDAWIKGAILIPKGEVITAANAVDFKTYMQNKLINNSPAARWRALYPFRSFTEGGREEQSEVMDDGLKIITSDPTEATTYMMVGNSCLGKNLLDFDNAQDIYDVLYVDKNGIILAQQATNATTGLLEFTGYPLDGLSVKMPTKATTAAVTKYMIEFMHVDPKALYKNRGVIDCSNFKLAQLFKTYAVQNVGLAESAVSGVAGTHTITAFASCANANLGVIYALELDDVARWSLVDATGTAKTITSVTVNAVTGVMTFVIDTPGTAGTKYYLTTKGVTDWATNNMKYFESQSTLTLTIV